MKAKTLTPMGALHPVLFFAGVYIVVLLFSVFICSSLFYSCNAGSADVAKKQETPLRQASLVTSSNAGAVAR